MGVTDAVGAYSGDPQHTTTTAYDDWGRMSEVTDQLGRATEYLYDNLGRKTEMIQPDPANGSADGKGPTTYYGYDADGNLKYETDPPGNTTSVGGTTYYFYDTLGRLVCTIDASADSSHGSWLASGVPDLAPAYSLGDDSTRTTYDALGDVASTEDQMGRTTVYVYDNLGRKTDMIQPDPATGQNVLAVRKLPPDPGTFTTSTATSPTRPIPTSTLPGRSTTP